MSRTAMVCSIRMLMILVFFAGLADTTHAANGTVLSELEITEGQNGFSGALDIDDSFGKSVTSLGDLDGDGVDDIAVGAMGDDDGGSDRGAVWILFLNADGTVKSHQKISSTSGGFTGTLDDGDLFGYAVTALDDLDGDAVVDLAVGAIFDDDGVTDAGALWILFLNSDGTVKSHQKISATAGGFVGPLALGDRFGSSAAVLGDFDGDNVVDLVVGAAYKDVGFFRFDTGAVFVVYLNADGTVKSDHMISNATGGFTGTLDIQDQFGQSVASLGDLDGDGVGDVAVGAFFDDDGGLNHGAVWILFMNTDGTVKSHQKISDTAGGFTGVLDDNDQLGVSVAAIGDVDCDGTADLAVGAHGDDDGGNGHGSVNIMFLNSNGTVKSHQKISSLDGGLTGPLGSREWFGWATTPLGDFNGDQKLDLLVGAPTFTAEVDATGAIWMLFLDGDPSCRVAANQSPDCSAAAIADQVAGANCQAVISATDVTGVTDPDGDALTITVSPTSLSLGANTVTVTADDGNGGTCSTQVTVNVTGGGAEIAGTVSVDGSGLAGVLVKLLDGNDPSIVVDEQPSGSLGEYSFAGIAVAPYQVMIVEPLGYVAGQNPVDVTNLTCGATATVDFTLTEIVLVNNARSKGYWKHQFDVYVRDKGNAQETEAELQQYIAEVRDRYTNPHYQTIFADMADGVDDFDEWQAVLSVKGNAGMEAKAMAQLAALALNVMSLKIGQYEIVTEDDRTAGDVLTFASELLTDADASNDELAKDVAEQVNNQQTIAAGVVPEGNILYKGEADAPRHAAPGSFVLAQNEPNPFNPRTTIRLSLPRATDYTITIYDIAGRQVRQYRNSAGAGEVSVVWDGTDATGNRVGSGMYFYSARAGTFMAQRKMLLLK